MNTQKSGYLKSFATLAAAAAFATAGSAMSPTQIMAPSPSAGDGYGSAVAFNQNGTELLVGNGSLSGISASPAVGYLYTLVSGQWQLTSTLTCSQGSLGAAVALSADGNTAMVSGATGTCLYRAAGGIWVTNPAVMATFSATPGPDIAVALSSDGNTALVGSAAGGCSGHCGTAAIYQAGGGGAWGPTPSAVATLNVVGNTELGYAVAISANGSTAVITDPFNTPAVGCVSGFNGAGYVFQASGGVWAASPTVVSTLTVKSCAKLGSSVAMSADGNTVFLGAPLFSNNTLIGAGGTLFRASSGTWAATPSATATLTTGQANNLGASAALSANGDFALLGDPGNNNAQTFQAINGTWPASPVAGVSLNGNTCRFGAAVALSGDGLTGAGGAPVCQPSAHGTVFVSAIAAPVYSPPVAANGTLSVTMGSTGNGMLSAAPASSSDTLTYAILSQPIYGTLTLTNKTTGAYTYLPNSGYSGSDSLTFAATDNQNLLVSNTATVSIAVGQAGGSGGTGYGAGSGAFGWLLLTVLAVLTVISIQKRESRAKSLMSQR